MTSGFVLGPGEGPAYGFHGSAVVIKASGEHTLGQIGVMESAYPPGLSVHEHVHAGEDEMFYLLEGELAVFCGEDHWTVSAGSFVFVPRGHPHGFTVTSPRPSRALVITGPARLDGQIAARGEPVPPGLGQCARPRHHQALSRTDHVSRPGHPRSHGGLTHYSRVQRSPPSSPAPHGLMARKLGHKHCGLCHGVVAR